METFQKTGCSTRRLERIFQELYETPEKTIVDGKENIVR